MHRLFREYQMEKLPIVEEVIKTPKMIFNEIYFNKDVLLNFFQKYHIFGQVDDYPTQSIH